MTKNKLQKYAVEFHDDLSCKVSLMTYYSDTPFLAFHVGDYVAQQTCGEGAIKPGERYQIIAVEHIITNETNGSHKLCVRVKAVKSPK